MSVKHTRNECGYPLSTRFERSFSFFTSNVACPHGALCKFAHGVDDLHSKYTRNECKTAATSENSTQNECSDSITSLLLRNVKSNTTVSSSPTQDVDMVNLLAEMISALQI